MKLSLLFLPLLLSLASSQLFSYNTQTIPLPPGLYNPSSSSSFSSSSILPPSTSFFPPSSSIPAASSSSFQEYNPENQMNFMESQTESATDAMTANVLLSQAEDLINKNKPEEVPQILESDFESGKNEITPPKEEEKPSILNLQNLNLSQGLTVGALNLTANGSVFPPDYKIVIGNQSFEASELAMAVNFIRKFSGKLNRIEHLFKKEVPQKEENKKKEDNKVSASSNTKNNLLKMKKGQKNVDENRFLQVKIQNKKKNLSKAEQFSDLDITNSIDLETEKKSRDVQDAVRTILNDANNLNSYNDESS